MIPLALLLPILLQASTAAPPVNLRNAKTTVSAVAPATLSNEVSRLAGGTGPLWIGYFQPILAGKHRMCCFGEFHGGVSDRNFCCGGCTLEKDSSFTIGDDDRRPVQLEGSAGLVVLFRAEHGRIGKVRALDDECGIDAGGLPFVWLTGVRPEESVALLASIARRMDDEHGGEDGAGSALAAIAFTAHPSADEALARLMAKGQPSELRKKAAFWTGNARGRPGFETLKAALSDPDADFRQHLTFALSQSPVREAQDLLIDMAKHDRDGDVRGQALFWLAQKAADRATETIQDAIRDDPDEEVKKKAVFALSQMHDGRAVPELIRVARTNRNAEVRKQAIFWLGQSKDPRALAFIEEVLSR
jgi:HEAT repeats